MAKKTTIYTLLILGVALATLITQLAVFLSKSANPSQQNYVFYEVHKHQTLAGTAKDLEQLGVISSHRWFYWYGRLSRQGGRLKVGDYRLSPIMTPRDIMGVLTSGISYGFPITFPEGLTMYQIADELAATLDQFHPGTAARFLALCTNAKFIASLDLVPPNQTPPRTLEGYLYPETYLIPRKMSEQDIIHLMVHRFHENYTPALDARAAQLGMTMEQVITLASIIEKETGASEERSMVSSVFHNRLKKRMRLQSDPTVIYGQLYVLHDYHGKIHSKALVTPTPYNTYTIPALPPAPISNPGKDSIVAALYPAESKYLYFVSHGDGTHQFSEDYATHRAAVEKYQLDPKAREGKSWRDLKKRNAN